MTVLVTNSDTPLAGAVASGLETEHEVRRTLWDEPLEPGSATAALVRDVRAVVHFGYPRRDGDAGELLDHATRRTYNLLLAAAEAGVERCVFVSTLRLLAALPAHLAVTEKWRSRPPSGDPARCSPATWARWWPRRWPATACCRWQPCAWASRR